MNRPFNPASAVAQRAATGSLGVIIRMSQEARRLREEGRDIVSLTIGEPDFDTPAAISQAATRAMAAGHTHYAPVNGLGELRRAISDKLKKENRADYEADEICLSNGAKQAIANTVLALVEPGDEVILLAPFWVAYRQIVELAGGIPVIVPAGADDGFKVPADRLSAALSDKTKLIFLNSPSNPSGAIYSKDELSALAQVISAHERAMVISDEIYEYIAFDAEPVSMAAIAGMKQRTIVINGFSKGFAMTGWRLGYAAAPGPVASAITKMQGIHSAGANMFVQHAALDALSGPRDCVEEMRLSYLHRRDLMVAGLGQIPGLRLSPPAGTFYSFPDVRDALGRSAGNHRIETVEDLCDWLLAEHGVACVPGSAFGDENCIRLSFAASEADIKKALSRLQPAFASLK